MLQIYCDNLALESAGHHIRVVPAGEAVVPKVDVEVGVSRACSWKGHQDGAVHTGWFIEEVLEFALLDSANGRDLVHQLHDIEVHNEVVSRRELISCIYISFVDHNIIWLRWINGVDNGAFGFVAESIIEAYETILQILVAACINLDDILVRP